MHGPRVREHHELEEGVGDAQLAGAGRCQYEVQVSGSDPEVVAALRAAVAASPDKVGLRLHLAELLLSDDPEGSLEQCRAVLGLEPDHVAALRLAARAAGSSGDTERASRYQRTADALEAGPVVGMPIPSTADTSGAAEEVELEHEEELDRFLADVLADQGGRPVTLADVGGLEEVKRRLQTSFLGPLRNPELRRMYGKSLRGGLLLYGPPGCGKTYLARALAGELGLTFLSVGLHEILDMWLGQSERNVHQLFEAARRRAPCVLFLDEVDALGLKRSALTHSAGRNVVVQFLAELDSARDDNEGVFVLGATNQPWDVDPALRRPGRFDRMLFVGPPDEAARRVIIESHLRDRPVSGIDRAKLARATDGFSGADLRLMCEAAAERALEDSIETGAARPISMADLQRGLAETSPSTRAWFEVARNYVIFANESGTYDDLLAYLRKLRLA